MQDLQALIWDVDGTLAETERDGHRVAFNTAFEILGLPWRWSEARYGELLAVTGGRERLLHDMNTQPMAPTGEAARDELARRLHAIKNEVYARIVASGRIPLRPGVAELLDECRAAGLPMAIATTTGRGNVDALLTAHLGSDWASAFAAVVCAEDAPAKKPDPLVYRTALARLGLAAGSTLAIEDSPQGMQACHAAGVPVLVTRSVYFAEIPVTGVVAVGPGLASGSGWLPAPLPFDAASAPPRIDLKQLKTWFTAARVE